MELLCIMLFFSLCNKKIYLGKAMLLLSGNMAKCLKCFIVASSEKDPLNFHTNISNKYKLPSKSLVTLLQVSLGEFFCDIKTSNSVKIDWQSLVNKRYANPLQKFMNGLVHGHRKEKLLSPKFIICHQVCTVAVFINITSFSLQQMLKIITKHSTNTVK